MENNIDFQVDETLEKCILSTPRKSFFLFAGAGSGKTYSLVLLLKKIHNSIGKDLLSQGKNVAVITFTNAATDEIINRLDYSPIFHISTIHSFVWDVIKHYQAGPCYTRSGISSCGFQQNLFFVHFGQLFLH